MPCVPRAIQAAWFTEPSGRLSWMVTLSAAHDVWMVASSKASRDKKIRWSDSAQKCRFMILLSWEWQLVSESCSGRRENIGKNRQDTLNLSGRARLPSSCKAESTAQRELRPTVRFILPVPPGRRPSDCIIMVPDVATIMLGGYPVNEGILSFGGGCYYTGYTLVVQVLGPFLPSYL